MIKVYEKNVIQGLKDLASYDFQKRAWLASAGHIVSSFSEDVCCLFDDTGLGDALKAGQIVFGKKADRILCELHDAIDKINYNLPPQVILDDPFMQLVRKKGLFRVSSG